MTNLHLKQTLNSSRPTPTNPNQSKIS